jgi:REP element-mobilizing transposase RayT
MLCSVAMPDELLFRKRYRISSARHPAWDYRWAGAYSVTICTRGRMRCLGEVVDGEVSLSPIGAVVAEEWLKIPHRQPRVLLDEWIVMPDHMHGILIFQGSAPSAPPDSKRLRSQSLGAAIGGFKSEATKRIWWNLKRTDFNWQTRFHDVILKTPEDLDHMSTLRRPSMCPGVREKTENGPPRALVRYCNRREVAASETSRRYGPAEGFVNGLGTSLRRLRRGRRGTVPLPYLLIPLDSANPVGTDVETFPARPRRPPQANEGGTSLRSHTPSVMSTVEEAVNVPWCPRENRKWATTCPRAVL